MNSFQNSHPSHNIQLVCPEHQEHVRGLCLFSGPCNQRLLCRVCRKTHDTNHLKFYEEFDDLVNGNIIQDVFKDFDSLIKRVDHQNMSYHRHKKLIAEQTESLFSKIQDMIHQSLQEIHDAFSHNVDQKLQGNNNMKSRLTLIRDEVEHYYSTSVASNFESPSVASKLVNSIFDAQNLKSAIMRDPEFTGTYSAETDLNFYAASMDKLFEQMRICLEGASMSLKAGMYSRTFEQDFPEEIPEAPFGMFGQGGGFQPHNFPSSFYQSRARNTAPLRAFETSSSSYDHHQPMYPSFMQMQNNMGGFNPQGMFNKPMYSQMQQQNVKRWTPKKMMFNQQNEENTSQYEQQFSNGHSALGSGHHTPTKKSSVIQPHNNHLETTSPLSQKSTNTPKKILEIFQKIDEQEKATVNSKGVVSHSNKNDDGDVVETTAAATTKMNIEKEDGEPRSRKASMKGSSRNKSEVINKSAGNLVKKTNMKTDYSSITFGGLAYAEDSSKLIISGSKGDEGSIEIWDIERDRRVHKFKAHEGDIFKVVYVEEKGLLFSAGVGIVNVWDFKNNCKLLTSFSGHKGPIFTMEYLPHMNGMLSGGEDGYVRLWKFEGKAQELQNMKTPDTRIGAICHVKDSNRIAVGFEKGHINVIELTAKTKKVTYTIKAHTSYVVNLASIEQRDWLISASNDGLVKIWNLMEAHATLFKEVKQPGTMVRNFGVFLDKDLLVTNHDSKNIHMWRLSTGENIKSHSNETFGEAMVVLKGRNEIATGVSKNVALWEIN